MSTLADDFLAAAEDSLRDGDVQLPIAWALGFLLDLAEDPELSQNKIDELLKIATEIRAGLPKESEPKD